MPVIIVSRCVGAVSRTSLLLSFLLPPLPVQYSPLGGMMRLRTLFSTVFAPFLPPRLSVSQSSQRVYPRLDDHASPKIPANPAQPLPPPSAAWPPISAPYSPPSSRPRTPRRSRSSPTTSVSSIPPKRVTNGRSSFAIQTRISDMIRARRSCLIGIWRVSRRCSSAAMGCRVSHATLHCVPPFLGHARIMGQVWFRSRTDCLSFRCSRLVRGEALGSALHKGHGEWRLGSHGVLQARGYPPRPLPRLVSGISRCHQGDWNMLIRPRIAARKSWKKSKRSSLAKASKRCSRRKAIRRERA